MPKIRRLIATALCLAVVLATPGMIASRAFAASVRVRVSARMRPDAPTTIYRSNSAVESLSRSPLPVSLGVRFVTPMAPAIDAPEQLPIKSAITPDAPAERARFAGAMRALRQHPAIQSVQTTLEGRSAAIAAISRNRQWEGKLLSGAMISEMSPNEAGRFLAWMMDGAGHNAAGAGAVSAHALASSGRPAELRRAFGALRPARLEGRIRKNPDPADGAAFDREELSEGEGKQGIAITLLGLGPALFSSSIRLFFRGIRRKKPDSHAAKGSGKGASEPNLQDLAKAGRKKLWRLLFAHGRGGLMVAASIISEPHPFYSHEFISPDSKGKESREPVEELLSLSILRALVHAAIPDGLRIEGSQVYDASENRMGIGEYPLAFPHEVGHWVFMRKLYELSGGLNANGEKIDQERFWKGHEGSPEDLVSLTESDSPALVIEYQRLVGAQTPQMLTSGEISYRMSLNENFADNIEKLTFGAPFVVGPGKRPSPELTRDILDFFVRLGIINAVESQDYLDLSQRLNYGEPVSPVAIADAGEKHVTPGFARRSLAQMRILWTERITGKRVTLAEEIAAHLGRHVRSPEDVSKWLKAGRGQDIVMLLEMVGINDAPLARRILKAGS